MTNVLVIGGGVAGTATALALHKAGLCPRIYEAYSTGADDLGAFLTIMPNGLTALAAIDAYQPVHDASFASQTTHSLKVATGETNAYPSGKGAGLRTLTRAALYRALHEEAHRRGIPIEHGKRLVDAHTHADAARACFADGTTADGDLLVGADGIWSRTRELLDSENPDPSTADLLVIYGAVQDAPDPVPEGYQFIWGAQAPYSFGYTTDPTGTTFWFLRISRGERSHRDVAAMSSHDWKAEALRYVTADDTSATGIVEATTNILGIEACHLPSIPTWHTATMTLIGDAAHAASPASAQGASMAIEDGVVLAKCLRDLNTKDAFTRFEQLRRERVEGVVAAGAAQTRGTTTGQSQQPSNTYEYQIDWDQPIAV